MNPKSIRSLLLLPLLASLFSSCGMIKAKEEAETRALKILDDRIAHGGVGDEKNYSAEFWKVTTPEEWGNIKQLATKANGNLKSYSLQTWNLNTKASTSHLSGTFVTLVFDTSYERGSGQERIILHRKNKSDPFEILGHNINTPEIAALVQKGINAAAKEQ